MPSKLDQTKSGAGQMMPSKLRLKLANECTNILSKTKLKANTKDRKFRLLDSKDVNEVTYNKLMTLFQKLMKEMYEQSSWGWKEPEKLAEWKHPKTKIMIVTLNDNCDPQNNITYGELPQDDEPLIGFMCFRFEIGGNKNECALYVYELHIDTEYQRQGLGEELMSMAKVLAVSFKMDKIMLTSFRFNANALKFYKKLNYTPDKSSPAQNEADYTILSSKMKL